MAHMKLPSKLSSGAHIPFSEPQGELLCEALGAGGVGSALLACLLFCSSVAALSATNCRWNHSRQSHLLRGWLGSTAKHLTVLNTQFCIAVFLHWYVFLYVRDKELCNQLQYFAGVADLSKTKAPYISFSFELSLTSFSMIVVNHFIILPRGLRPCSLYLSLQSTSLLWMWICGGMCGGNSLISPSPLSPYL